MEFRWSLSTHDVLTYSAKATRHKQVYPYLRYGLVVGKASQLPGRFFTYNAGMDFAVAAASYGVNQLRQLFRDLLYKEVVASRELERITFGKAAAYLCRTDVVIEPHGSKIV